MCDCWMCNQTQEEFDEGYLEWEYEQYCKTTDKPLTMDGWIQTLPSPEENKGGKENE